MALKYIAFYKPYGVLCQFTGEEGDRTLSEFNLPKEVYPVGRLDKDSEGLLVLSNDGPFIKKLLDPSSNKEKTYFVQVEKIPQEQDLEKFRKGPTIKGYKTKPAKVKIIKDPGFGPRNPPIRARKNIPTSWLEVILTEGKNRQVRRMTAAIGFPTLRLVRVQVEKLHLGDLLPGEYKSVSKKDII